MPLAVDTSFKERLSRLPDSFHGGWKISLHPWTVSGEQKKELAELGLVVAQFSHACHFLYHASLEGKAPSWVAYYLELGKSEKILSFARKSRLGRTLATVIRPDLIQTEEGWIACELDSVPGGIGLMAQFQEIYSELFEEKRFEIIGGKEGMVKGFLKMLASDHLQWAQQESTLPLNIAMVVPDSAVEYWGEMEELAARFSQRKAQTSVLSPEQLEYREAGVFYQRDRISLIYRFFETYEFSEIPHGEFLLKAVEQNQVQVLPPILPHLEEKMEFAFFHHPELKDFWIKQLGLAHFEILQTLFPKTWILDPRPSYYSVSARGFEFRGGELKEWNDLSLATQKERSRWVIKPSGYSPLAWGARGIRVGEDLPRHAWKQALESALSSFEKGPWLLQEWKHPIRQEFDKVSFDEEEEKIEVRTRISPFYFIHGKREDGIEAPVTLGGILATLCPLDKKIVHGMPGAVLSPVGTC